MFKNHLS